MDKDYLNSLRHSCSHLLAAAVLELYPNAKPTLGPPIDDGFYYDFDFSAPISENDLPRIEEKMNQLIKVWRGFERSEVPSDEAKQRYANNPYKRELIEEFSAQGQTISFYKAGDFEDLCRGGHVENPSKELKHFKLLSVAGAYWRGSEKNKMLTRIYGTAFPTKEELEARLKMLEEAKKRDHRVIGKALHLFTFDNLAGKGLPLWLPHGTIMKDEVEKYAKEMEERFGYIRVSTPHVGKKELFETSGHLPYYADSMYPPMKMDDGVYYLKAMNCPHHHLIYRAGPKSYRDLPLRLAEYGTVYRNELSGTLAGLLRVRSLQMNDAHVYCRKDQIKDEIERVLALTLALFKTFGLKEYWFRLSKWDPANKEKYIDEPDNWTYAEAVLRDVLKASGEKYEEVDNEAAFYGPKIDVQFKSAVGREETMSTIQLDFAAKKRFRLVYTDQTGVENNEVFVIHRAPLSTHERFMAFLIEHYAGAFPVWLSPVQVVVLPVKTDHNDSAHTFADELKKEGIRVSMDDSNETIGNKIRKASGEKIPYQLVFGDKEINSDELMVRVRGEKEQEKMTRQEFLARVTQEIAIRA